jgi:hypothetical protein
VQSTGHVPMGIGRRWFAPPGGGAQILEISPHLTKLRHLLRLVTLQS